MKDISIKEWFIVRKSNELNRNTAMEIFTILQKSEKALRVMDSNGLIYWVPNSALQVMDMAIDEDGCMTGFDTYDNPEEVKALIDERIAKYGYDTFESARRAYNCHNIAD